MDDLECPFCDAQRWELGGTYYGGRRYVRCAGCGRAFFLRERHLEPIDEETEDAPGL